MEEWRSYFWRASKDQQLKFPYYKRATAIARAHEALPPLEDWHSMIHCDTPEFVTDQLQIVRNAIHLFCPFTNQPPRSRQSFRTEKIHHFHAVKLAKATCSIRNPPVNLKKKLQPLGTHLWCLVYHKFEFPSSSRISLGWQNYSPTIKATSSCQSEY
jgi:hypothetical protein